MMRVFCTKRNCVVFVVLTWILSSADNLAGIRSDEIFVD